MKQQQTSSGPLPGVTASLLVIMIGTFGLLLWWLDPDAYYSLAQEDKALEWSTFWAFVGAAGFYLYAAAHPDLNRKMRWFPISLSLFCLFVALEEISWGQRIFGYRPPEYFLQFNYQQELNFHNVIETRLRKLGLIAVIFGYGVALPLLNLIPSVRLWFHRFGIVAPALELLPAFLLTGIGQHFYPIKFTGEWIEMMLAASLLFAALIEARSRPSAVAISATLCIILAAGVASAKVTNRRPGIDPANVDAARIELDALQSDFASNNRRAQRCGFHRRLFTYAENTGQSLLTAGTFARLTNRNLPEQRAAFFLDPWDSAYWIRDNCATDGRPHTIYLYSFGPNRRRDSAKWEIRGDDIAVLIRGNVDTDPSP